MTEKAFDLNPSSAFLPRIPLTLLFARGLSAFFLASCSKSSSSSTTPAAATPGALASITITASSTTLADTDTSETGYSQRDR